MGKGKIEDAALTFRPATLEDAELASGLLFDTFPKVATFTIGLGSETRAKRILAFLFSRPDNRFSYSVTTIAQYHNRIVGLMSCFPAGQLGRFDRKMTGMVLKQYQLRGKIALILRGWQMVFLNEARRDEYLLSNLAVRKNYRSRGVGARMLAHLEALAKEKGYHKIALRVAIENQAARQFYEQYGYKTKAIHLESNRRVPYIGAGYRRMIKTLTD